MKIGDCPYFLLVRIAPAGAALAMMIGFLVVTHKYKYLSAPVTGPTVKTPNASGDKIAFSDETVEAGIRNAVEFLWSRQDANGGWADFVSSAVAVIDKHAIACHPAGPAVLAVYALLEAGEDPESPRMEKALEWLATHKDLRTYSLESGDWTVADPNVLRCCLQKLEVDDLALIASAPDSLRRFSSDFVSRVERGNLGGDDLFNYLYRVKNVGLASNRKHFGDKPGECVDWYKFGATKLLNLQEPDGSFRGGRWGPDVSASYALLFLVRDQGPVMFNKLEHEPRDDWNNHPRDLANLTEWISSWMGCCLDRRSSSRINWQIINQWAQEDEWHDASILYVTGSQKPWFSESRTYRLRDFVDHGGMIFSCSQGEAFDKEMKRSYDYIFPEYELRTLPADHPLYSLFYKLLDKETGQPRVKFQYIHNGVRILALHLDEDISKLWQLNHPGQDRWAFEAGINVVMYANEGKPPLTARLESHS